MPVGGDLGPFIGLGLGVLNTPVGGEFAHKKNARGLPGGMVRLEID